VNAKATKVADDEASKFVCGDIEASKDILGMGLEGYPVANEWWYQGLASDLDVPARNFRGISES